MDDESKVVQLLTEIRDNQRAQMEVASVALKRSHRSMRIILVWLLMLLAFLSYVAYNSNKRYDELKKQHQDLMGEFEA